MRGSELKMKITEGKEKEYKKYVRINSKDGYSSCVVRATEAVGKVLDEGKSPSDAMEIKNKDLDELTGFMAGCLAKIIVHFHPRGKEFQKWWNSQYGVKSDKGTVNPAILKIKAS